MGCIASKQAVTPAFDHSGSSLGNSSSLLSSSLRNRSYRFNCDGKKGEGSVDGNELEGSRRGSSRASYSSSFRLGNLTKYIEGEQVAAGWPSWLTAVAGEAIQGWIPLSADSYEKLEKIGQGTYSNVFRARDVNSGAIVALKKVRFDNFDPESVRFMSREIQILRRLDHPNVVKLDGLITSKFSCSIYLVFEYMEHDLAGLSSCPDIHFSESQVKCYLQQLLLGLDHCHSRGIMHRDIKCSNLLVNNEGILKIADFGLANFRNPVQNQPLTSRVVTLWYRPPELLLGSTGYTASVDLWSVGCVFAELFFRKPILQGRTEVEQLHKIFKLCGSPPEDYWRNSKLPHATIFKPQQPYESSLCETFNSFPPSALALIEILLSVEPYKRGSASSALKSEYFITKPHACDPATLPKYPPNKEIDAKSREEALRKKVPTKTRGFGAARRQTKVQRNSREENISSRLVHQESQMVDAQNNKKHHGSVVYAPNKLNIVNPNDEQNRVVDATVAPYHAKHDSLGDIAFSGPLVPTSGGFTWARKRKDDKPNSRIHSRSSSKVMGSSAKDSSDLSSLNKGLLVDSERHDSNDLIKRVVLKRLESFDLPSVFDSGSEISNSQKTSPKAHHKVELFPRNYLVGYKEESERVEYSGPLLSQLNKVDEMLQRNERRIRRSSWFQKVAGGKQRNDNATSNVGKIFE